MIDPKESLKLWHISWHHRQRTLTKKSRLRRDAKKFGWTVYWSLLVVVLFCPSKSNNNEKRSVFDNGFRFTPLPEGIR